MSGNQEKCPYGKLEQGRQSLSEGTTLRLCNYYPSNLVTNVIVIVQQVISKIMLSTNIQASFYTNPRKTYQTGLQQDSHKPFPIHREIYTYIRHCLFQNYCKMHRQSKCNSPLTPHSWSSHAFQ